MLPGDGRDLGHIVQRDRDGEELMHVTGACGVQHGVKAAAMFFKLEAIKVAMRIDKHPETLRLGATRGMAKT
ncbi:hypothetical protein HHA02_30560 [Cobetia marina]|nr:hypothetical protein HHA02_30560 [Cobetia marina]